MIEKFCVRPPSFVFRFFSYLSILVAFFLRAYRLADKNVWWDEGWSVWLAQKDLAWIALRTAMDEHPPLHYWLLHFWNYVAGTDAFAGRFVSLFFGVLTVALLYRIGKKIGGQWVGLLTAFLLAIARFHIWWSQDIKNYTPSIFFAFTAVWFALRMTSDEWRVARDGFRHTSPPVTRHIVLYALCAAFAMWTHYLAALVLLALNLYALVIILRSPFVLRHSSSVIGYWLIANLLAALLFAPWLILYLQNAAEWTAAPAFDLVVFLKLVATVLPLGITTNIDDYAALTIAFTTIVGLGSLWIFASRTTQRGSRTTFHVLLFILIVIFPPFLIYILSLTPASFFAPKIQARYLLILLPAYIILLTLGIAVLRRFSMWLAIAATVFVIGANLFVLNDHYAERRLRDEYTTLANTINSFARQGDLVLLNTDQEWPTFLYYLRYPLDWLGVPNGKPMTENDADALVRRALNRHDAIWLVMIPEALATDPQKLLEARLARELPKRFEQTFHDKRLVLYARDERDLVNVAPENFDPQFVRAVRVNDNLELLGFDLPVREARGGDAVWLVTYWNARATSEVIVNSQTILVPQGQRVRVQTDLTAPPTLTGDLVITLGAKEIARVRVEPRPEFARANHITYPSDVRFGDAIHFAGYDLPSAIFRTGDAVPITLYWRTEKSIEKSYTVFVHIVGEQFNPKQNNPLWGQADRVPSPPTSAWLPSEIVPDVYAVKIDPDAPPGKYQIEIGMYDAATGARLPIASGNDSIILAEIQITH